MKEGFRHASLVTIEKIRKSSKKLKLRARWLCQCDCGNQIIVDENQLYGRGTKSCGCWEYKNKKIHDKENYTHLMKEKIKKYTVVDENGCWLWQGSKHKQGYGNLSYRQIPSLAHRVSWMVYNGEIPEGMKVCHRCDVTSCCNPDHLFLGTQKDNVKDCVTKGRFTRNVSKTRRNVLHWDQVQDIKKLHGEGVKRKELEKKFGVSQTCIAKILTGKSWQTNWTQEQ